jgi:predicted MPP superfamily phosphohydrolase
MRRRFAFAFLLIQTGLFAYFFFRVLAPLRPRPMLFGVLTGLVTLAVAAFAWLPLVYWRIETDEPKSIERAIEKFAHLGMGFLSFLLFATVLRDLAELALFCFGRADGVTGETASLALIGIAGLLSAIGFGLARAGPVVRRVALGRAGREILGGAMPLRVVQISDLHVGTWIRRRYVEGVVNRIAELGAIDLFVLTGDIGDGDPKTHATDLEPLGRVEARLGKFAVTGNHEGYWDEAAWNDRVRALGFRLLENETVALRAPQGSLTIHGVSDSRPDPRRALAELRPGAYSIFLAHQPKASEAAIAAGVDLQLSGHTHRGQFLPWSLFIGLAHRFAAGLYRVGKTTIYVNAGTGFWGPPFRLGTRSEITLFEIALD